MGQKNSHFEAYKRIKVLGEGSYGKAYLAKNPRRDSLCVIKEVDLSRMSRAEKDLAISEVKILESLNHPNIIKFLDVYKTKKGLLCIVMEYAENGDLASKIEAQNGKPFPEDLILDWFTQICLALKHVHDRKVLHRDLKSKNIFLGKGNVIKLGDFGIAKALSDTFENAKTVTGTPYYFSPELIQGQPYSFKSDIWSLGVLLYEMCSLKPPFEASNIGALVLKIQRGNYSPIPKQYSTELQNLVDSLLQLDPFRRPNINGILENPIIQERIYKFLPEDLRSSEFSHTILHNKKMIKDMHLENINVVTHQELILPKVQPDLKVKRNPGNSQLKYKVVKPKTQQQRHRDNDHLKNPNSDFRSNHFERPHGYKRSKTPYPFSLDDVGSSSSSFQTPKKSSSKLKDNKKVVKKDNRTKTPHPATNPRTLQVLPDEKENRSKTPKLASSKASLVAKDEKKLALLVQKYPFSKQPINNQKKEIRKAKSFKDIDK